MNETPPPGNDPPEITALLRRGSGGILRDEEAVDWLNYLAQGIRPEHAARLIEIATDRRLHRSDPDGVEVWAPMHAWRALAQLHCAAAIEPLLAQLNRLDDMGDDWSFNDYTKVFRLLGPPAVQPLLNYAANTNNRRLARTLSIECLEAIVADHPETAAEIVAGLLAFLANYERDSATVNAAAISLLTKLKSVAAAELIERAFAAGCVDETWAGDWHDIRAELGVPGLGLVPELSEAQRKTLQWRRSAIQYDVLKNERNAERRNRKSRRKARRQGPKQA